VLRKIMNGNATTFESRMFGQYVKRQGKMPVIPLRPSEQAATIRGSGTVKGDYPAKIRRGESIATTLIDYVKINKLVAGDSLPTEAQLSTIMGVGTRSLREGLMMLKALGVVEARQGKGWLVGKFDVTSNVPIILGPLIQHFNQATMREVYEARLFIEPGIAGLAAGNITQEGYQKLAKALEAIKKNADVSPREVKIADREFHDIIAEMCGNKVLSLQSSLLSGLFLSMIIRLDSRDDNVFQQHEEIYTKLVARDADGAELATRSHLEYAIWYMEKCGLC
jgi:GntR family transcriptional regulator, transcriptional repressor for pyruvate dehydrogenase complex